METSHKNSDFYFFLKNQPMLSHLPRSPQDSDRQKLLSSHCPTRQEADPQCPRPHPSLQAGAKEQLPFLMVPALWFFSEKYFPLPRFLSKVGN